MDEDPLKTLLPNRSPHTRIHPRPLIECLDVQPSFEQRNKKNKTFGRTDTSKNIIFVFN